MNLVERIRDAIGLDSCMECGVRKPRRLPDPIPEDMPIMFTEMMVGRGLYCQRCFDLEEEE